MNGFVSATKNVCIAAVCKIAAGAEREQFSPDRTNRFASAPVVLHKRAGQPARGGKMRPWDFPAALSPFAAKAFRVVLLAVTICIAVLTLATNIVKLTRSHELPPFVSIGLQVRAGNLHLRPIDAETLRSGVRLEDQLVAIDGAPVGSVLQAERQIRAAKGDWVLVTVRRAGSERELRLRRSVDHVHAATGVKLEQYLLAYDVSQAALAVAALVALGMALLLGYLQPRVPVAALMSVGLVGVATIAIPDPLPHALERMVLAIQAIGFWAFQAAVLEFPDGRGAGRGRRVLRCIGLIWLACCLTAQAPALRWAMLHVVIAGTALNLIALAVLVRRYVGMDDFVQRQQVRWVLVGIGAGVILFAIGVWGPWALRLLLGVIWASFWHAIWMDGLAAAALLAATAGLSFSVLKYRLYSVDTVIVRSVVYPVISVAVVCFFTVVERLTSMATESVLPAGAPLASASMAAVASGLLIGPAHSRLRNWTVGRLKSDVTVAREKLPNLVLDWRELQSDRALLLRVMEHLRPLLHVEDLAWVDRGRTLTLAGASRLIPELSGKVDEALIAVNRSDADYPVRLRVGLTEGSPRTAWLLVGRHADRSLIGREERRLLEALAVPLARSLDAVALRRSASDRSSRRRKHVSSTISQLHRWPRS